jgi:hypothetical protein
MCQIQTFALRLRFQAGADGSIELTPEGERTLGDMATPAP